MNFKSILILNGKEDFNENHFDNIKILDDFISTSFDHLGVPLNKIDFYVYLQGKTSINIAEDFLEYQKELNIKFLIPFISYNRLIFSKEKRDRYERLMQDKNCFVLNQIVKYDFLDDKDLRSRTTKSDLSKIYRANFRQINNTFDFICLIGSEKVITKNLLTTEDLNFKDVKNYCDSNNEDDFFDLL